MSKSSVSPDTSDVPDVDTFDNHEDVPALPLVVSALEHVHYLLDTLSGQAKFRDEETEKLVRVHLHRFGVDIAELAALCGLE